MVQKNKGKVNILLTSVGRRVELVKAFRNAYHSLQISGNIVATDIDPLAPALEQVDKKYFIPRTNTNGFIPAIATICRQENIHRVFPLIDPDISVLSANRKSIETAVTRLAVVSLDSSELCNDKWLTTQFFNLLKLPTPKSWLPDNIDLKNAQFPLFIKPRNGSASKHTYRVNNLRELDFFMNYVENPIIQECIVGPEITNDVICDVTGELLGIVSRRRIEVRGGEITKGVTIFDAPIIEACKLIARELPSLGPITVQCIVQSGIPYFTEINARLGGGIPLGIAAGADSPRWLLARAAGVDIEIPPIGSYEVGLYISRFDDSYFISEKKHEEIGRNRI